MDSVVIDLGLDRDTPELATRDRVRRWGRSVRRWSPALRGRQLVATAAALALTPPVVAGLAASAPHRPLMAPVFTVAHDENTSFTVDGESLYTITRTDGDLWVHVYRLADGARRWSVRVATPPGAAMLDFANLQLAGSLALFSGVNSGGTEWTVAYERATGRERWTYPGTVFSTTTGGSLVAARSLAPPCEAPCEETEQVPQELAVLDASSGRPLWTVEVRNDWGGFSLIAPPGAPNPDRLATIDGGRLEVRTLATGMVLATRLMSPGSAETQWGAWPVEDLLIVTRWDSGTVTAYDATTLDERWTVLDMADSGAVWSCIPAMLCAQNGAGVSVHDVRTGALSWQVAGRRPQVALGERYVIAGRDDGRDTVLYDARTGREILPLGNWHPLSSDGTPFGGHLMAQFEPSSQRLWLGLLRPERPELAHLGRLPGQWHWCTTGLADPPPSAPTIDLVCTGPGGVLTVWRVHAPPA